MSARWHGPEGAPEVGRRVEVPALHGCRQHEEEVWLAGTVVAVTPGYRWARVELDAAHGRTASIRFQQPAACPPEWAAWLAYHPEPGAYLDD